MEKVVYSEVVTKCLHPYMVKPTEDSPAIPVPCGRCIACKMRRTKEWSLRLEMEAKDYTVDEMQFITLTYAPDYIPVSYSEVGNHVVAVPSLYKKDIQLFLKRLRRSLSYPIRYYFVGEYGSRTFRPHYHAIVYGLKTCDNYKVREAWRQGFVCVKPFFNETTVYVAGYIQKKLFGKDKYLYELPPFVLCSQRLGLNFCLRPDVLANILADSENCIYVNGFKRGLPRYIRRKLTEMGYLEPRTVSEVLDDYECQSSDFAQSLENKNISYSDYLWNWYSELQRKFLKNNRKRNANVEV